MHGETAAVASFSRRLVEEKEAGRPLYCALRGFVDEAVRFGDIRRCLVAFAGAAYQNPASICPQHQVLPPRLIRSQIVKGLERPKRGA